VSMISNTEVENQDKQMLAKLGSASIDLLKETYMGDKNDFLTSLIATFERDQTSFQGQVDIVLDIEIGNLEVKKKKKNNKLAL